MFEGGREKTVAKREEATQTESMLQIIVVAMVVVVAAMACVEDLVISTTASCLVTEKNIFDIVLKGPSISHAVAQPNQPCRSTRCATSGVSSRIGDRNAKVVEGMQVAGHWWGSPFSSPARISLDGAAPLGLSEYMERSVRVCEVHGRST